MAERVQTICDECNGDGHCNFCEGSGDCDCVERDGQADPDCAVCSGNGGCLSCTSGECPECDGLGTVDD